MYKINFPIFLQGIKFLVVGVLNTFIDFGVLNLLIFFTGIAQGLWYSIFKAISFTTAVINSYFMNKFWTFKAKEATNPKEFGQFFIVSAGGFLLNVGTASFLVNFIGPRFGISKNLWANIGALGGTVVAFLWNFAGYKFFVFKK